MNDQPSPSLYRALDPDINEIRVLTAIAVDAADRVTCRLITVPIHECPPYAALSYVWGQATDLEEIQVNGQAFQATPSLARALRYVPRHWQTKYPGRALTELRLWADAVCINQRDLEEKSRQVRLMGDIFSGAELVMCWMPYGISHFFASQNFSEDTQDLVLETAFNTLGLIDWELRLVKQEAGVTTLSSIENDDKRLVQWLAKYPELIETAPGCKWSSGNKNWDAIRHFTDLQYWKRVWIFQEVALAKEALLMCKSSCISLRDTIDHVFTWLGRLSYCDLSAPSFVSPDLWESLVSGNAVNTAIVDEPRHVWRRRGTGIPKKYWDIFHRAIIWLGATNPKDKVYGMLSVIGIDLRPDYSDQTSVAKVFRDMTVAWLQDYASAMEGTAASVEAFGLRELWFLSYGGLRHYCEHADCHHLSSWAPNLLHSGHRLGVHDYLELSIANADYYVFSDEQSQELSYIQDSSLFVTGVHVDSVHETYPQIVKAGDIFELISGLFRNNASEFSGLRPKRRLLRDLFELLVWEHLGDMIWFDRRNVSDPSSFNYLEFAFLFVWTMISASSKRNHDGNAIALACTSISHGGSQYRAAIETLGLESDTNAGFVFSLRETFLDLVDAAEEELGVRSGSDYDEIPSSWLQVLVDSEATGGMPREGMLAARLRRATEDLEERTMQQACLFLTSRGHFGIGPRKTITCGDALCVLKGCKSVAVLRETGDHFIYIGEAKIQGMMDGEAAQLLKEGLAEVRQFELK